MAGDNTDGSIGMLREADLALYAAKSAGKGTYHFFETSLHHAVLARLEQRAALEEAIDTNQLCLHYQPILNLADGTMVGVEALVRWEHPTKGLIPPIEFIPLAEDSGLVVSLGRWVLDRACADLYRWQCRWKAGTPQTFNVAINVSPRQLQSSDFLTVVDDTIHRHHIDPSWLTFEITESLLVQDSADVMTRLVAVHDLGIALALDDFGTGYSSLSYLNRFPIQILKIDQSFVAGIDESNLAANGTTLIKAIVSMAQSLGLDLVAEGIENESQRRLLASLGCTYGQGYHLGRPVTADAIDALIGPITATPPALVTNGRPS
jgi:EAL domain-containing protein (putative c-di-GMP-specific phosphodiesterase class I)